MSDESIRPGSPGSPGERALHLGQHRKRAKELLRAHRAGDEEAARRIAAHLPRARSLATVHVFELSLRLAEAQFVVAREAGFASWPRLKRAAESARLAALDADQRTEALLAATARGDEARVDELLALDPGIPERSLHAACALGERAAADALLAADAGRALLRDGAGDWTPIHHLCCSGIAAKRQRAGERTAIAARLLEAGADPRDSSLDPRLIQGERSVLSGAVAFVGSPELVRLLLDAGAASAENLWHMAILADAVRLPDLGCMRLLLPLGPPSWELNGALAELLGREEPDGIRLLLEAGANPNTSGVWGRSGTTLHQAILSGRGRGVLRALLDGGADPAIGDRDGRGALAIAVRAGAGELEELLLERGADPASVAAVDRAIGACVRGRPEELARIRLDEPALRSRFERTDHQMVAWAVRRALSDEVLGLLLELGLDPNVPDDDGESALALAAEAGRLSLVERLLEAGARPDAADFDGRVALERAASSPALEPESRRAIVTRLLAAGAHGTRVRTVPEADEELGGRLRSAGAVERDDAHALFERAADAVVEGDLEALGALLEDDPELVHARSARPHRATLLHYVAANGLETHRQKTPENAPRVLEALLAAGAEPDALCRTYGGGPAQTTLSLLVSSGFPAERGVQGELTGILCDAGADPNGLDDDGVPLATAIAFGCRQAVDALASHARLDNPLFAAAAGRLDLLETMLDGTGAAREGSGHCRVPWLHMPRDARSVGVQAMVCAARLGRSDVVRWLVGRGVDPAAPAVAARTALHEAAVRGDLELARFLVEHGADAGLRDEQFDSTAIGWALEGGHRDLCEFLVAHGEPDYSDAIMLGLHERVRAFLDESPELANGTEGKGGPLCYAAAHGDEPLVRVLLDAGADPSLAGGDGRTALDPARAEGHAEVVRLLEERRARP